MNKKILLTIYGECLFGGLPDNGELYIFVRKEGYKDIHKELKLPATELQLIMEKNSTLTVELIAPDGSTINGEATISFTEHNSVFSKKVYVQDNKFSLNLVPSIYKAFFITVPPNFIGYQGEFQLISGIESHLTIWLKVGGEITGTVIDAERNEPLESAIISSYRSGNSLFYMEKKEVESDKNGRFTIIKSYYAV